MQKLQYNMSSDEDFSENLSDSSLNGPHRLRESHLQVINEREEEEEKKHAQ